MEEVKRTVRIVWLKQRRQETPLVTEQHRPTATATSIMELTNALGTLTTRQTTGVQLMVVTSSHS